MKYIIILFSTIILLSCGWERSGVQSITHRYLGSLYLDTILVKDVQHEFIISNTYGGGQILIHSPECQCLKKE